MDNTNNHTVTIRNCNRDVWLDFVAKCKKERKTAWEVLEPILKEYVKKK